MAQIVCIDQSTVRKDICDIGDIVAMHEDDVELSGDGYKNFQIIKIQGKKVADLDKIWLVPEQKEVDGKQYWKNNEGKWCELVSNPKYSTTLQNFTILDKSILADKETSLSTMNTLLAKYQEKIHLDTKNNTEASALNA